MNEKQRQIENRTGNALDSPSASGSNRLIRTIQNAYNQVIRIHGTPREIALGMALGLFVGMSPFMGVHMAIAVFFATLFGWNKLSAAIGVWISNPLTAIFLYSLTYIIGAELLGIDQPFFLKKDPDYSFLMHMFHNAPEFLMALTVGGIIIGIPLAIVGYYLTLSAVTQYQNKLREKIAMERAKLAQGVSNLAEKIRERKKKKRKKKKRRRR